MKKFTALILCFLLVFGSVSSVFAANSNDSKGTTIRLAKTDGSVSVSDSAGSAVSFIKNMKLYDGYQVATAQKSYAYISLDDTKALKLNASTSVEVRKSGKKLEIFLNEGSLFFNVSEKMSSDETMNIRTNTMVTGITGTAGEIGVNELKLISGSVTVRFADGKIVELQSGNSVSALETGAALGEFVAEKPVEELTELSGFALEYIKETPALQERLKENFSTEQIEEAVEAADAILAADEKQAEEEAAKAVEEAALQEKGIFTVKADGTIAVASSVEVEEVFADAVKPAPVYESSGDSGSGSDPDPTDPPAPADPVTYTLTLGGDFSGCTLNDWTSNGGGTYSLEASSAPTQLTFTADSGVDAGLFCYSFAAYDGSNLTPAGMNGSEFYVDGITFGDDNTASVYLYRSTIFTMSFDLPDGFSVDVDPTAGTGWRKVDASTLQCILQYSGSAATPGVGGIHIYAPLDLSEETVLDGETTRVFKPGLAILATAEDWAAPAFFRTIDGYDTEHLSVAVNENVVVADVADFVSETDVKVYVELMTAAGVEYAVGQAPADPQASPKRAYYINIESREDADRFVSFGGIDQDFSIGAATEIVVAEESNFILMGCNYRISNYGTVTNNGDVSVTDSFGMRSILIKNYGELINNNGRISFEQSGGRDPSVDLEFQNYAAIENHASMELIGTIHTNDVMYGQFSNCSGGTITNYSGGSFQLENLNYANDGTITNQADADSFGFTLCFALDEDDQSVKLDDSHSDLLGDFTGDCSFIEMDLPPM